MRAAALVPLLVVAALLGGAACRRDDSRKTPTHEELRRALAELARRKAAKEAARLRSRESPAPGASSAVAARARGVVQEAEAPDERDAPTLPSPPPPSGDAPWIVDEPADLGPGAPATATSLGVLVNDREGNLAVLRLGPLPRGASPGSTPLPPLPEGSGPYSLGRGPGLFDGGVYWISHGSLVRRALSPRGTVGPLEILAKDAHDGTRVAVPVPAKGHVLAKIPATVAYIVRPEKDDAPLVAKLWVEGAPSVGLTAEGNSTHSVSIVHGEDGVLVFSVQARMAMTPVHARKVRYDAGKPILGDDVVVWVGGGIQPLTEMTLLPNGDHDLFGFIPHERSIQEFGVAELALTMTPGMDTKTTWLVYPNGIDPAPVSADHLCGEPVLLYAAPESARPGSPQELLLRSLSDGSGKRTLRVSTGRAFYFASIAEVPGGALAVWVGEDGTHASTVRCTKRGK